MRYWDSSAIVPLLLAEQSSATLGRLYRADPEVFTWWATPVECISALSRRGRMPGWSAAESGRALGRLARVRSRWFEITPGADVRALAELLVANRDLRAADAFQLAAALIASREADAPLPFVCLDNRLRTSADAEGLPLLS